MEKQPFIRGKAPSAPTPVGPKPVVLRKHGTLLPVPKIPRIEPGRILLIPLKPDDEREALARVWEEAGGRVERVGRIWEPDPAYHSQCLCVYGNAIFCSVLADTLGLQLIGPPDDWLAHLPGELLGRGVWISRLDQAKTLPYPCFVRSLPAHQFTSGIVTSFQGLSQLTSGLEPHSGLLVSEVIKVEAEARAFLYDRKVLDISIYRRSGDLEAATEVASAVGNLENAPFGFAIDLGRVGGHWFVLRLSPSWGTRLRGCDPGKVFLSVAAATRA